MGGKWSHYFGVVMGYICFCGPECVAVLANFIHDTFPCLDVCGLHGCGLSRSPTPPSFRVWTAQFRYLEGVSTSHLNPLGSLPATVEG